MGERILGLVALLVGLLVAGCGVSTVRLCAEGDQVACTCPGGEPSQRICLTGGLGYSTCVGCRRDAGVAVSAIDEDLREPVQVNDDAGPPSDLAGADLKPLGCTSASCAGCCDGNTCVVAASQTNARCHLGSLTACQTCPAGYACVADQACAKEAPSCDAASCPFGCCDGTICLLTDPSHCGTGGSACTSCAKGTLCSEGACANDLDPRALFYVTVSYLEAEATDDSGASWDTFSTADPKVCFVDGTGQLACTAICTDNISCSYSPAEGLLHLGANTPDFDDALGGPWAFYGSELATGLPFRVWDMDYIPLHRYDTIASGTMFKIEKLRTQYSILPYQRVRSLKFTVTPL